MTIQYDEMARITPEQWASLRRRCMVTDCADEWGHFLHARKLLIDRFVREGEYTFEDIARTLSMDPVQVQLISMTPVDPRRHVNRKRKQKRS
jgi:hypothetical protein